MPATITRFETEVDALVDRLGKAGLDLSAYHEARAEVNNTISDASSEERVLVALIAAALRDQEVRGLFRTSCSHYVYGTNLNRELIGSDISTCLNCGQDGVGYAHLCPRCQQDMRMNREQEVRRANLELRRAREERLTRRTMTINQDGYNDESHSNVANSDLPF